MQFPPEELELEDELELDDDDEDEDEDEELDDEELKEEEEEELDELLEDDEDDPLPPPIAWKAASEGVPEPLPQKPKLTDEPAEIFWFHESGVTTLPFRVPFHRLLIWVPAGSRVTDQSVTAELPLFAISTCAQ